MPSSVSVVRQKKSTWHWHYVLYHLLASSRSSDPTTTANIGVMRSVYCVVGGVLRAIDTGHGDTGYFYLFTWNTWNALIQYARVMPLYDLVGILGTLFDSESSAAHTSNTNTTSTARKSRIQSLAGENIIFELIVKKRSKCCRNCYKQYPLRAWVRRNKIEFRYLPKRKNKPDAKNR